MSIEFTFALAGPLVPLTGLMADIESAFAEAGFVRSPAVCRVELDDRGVFDEIDEDILSIDSFAGTSIPENWGGLSVEFNNNEYSIYVLIGSHQGKYRNAFLDISSQVLDQLVETDKLDQFIHLVLIVASKMKAAAGFGTYELDFEPLTTEQAFNAIFKTPDNMPSTLGLVSYHAISKAEIKNMEADQFSITSSTFGYFILEHVDLNPV